MANMKDVLNKLQQVDMNKVGKHVDHLYKEIDFMLAELQETDVYEGLTEWEQDFSESLLKQFGVRHNLSEKQVNILRKIYDKHCM